jgi:uncharacterized protein (DUF1697 family)
MQSFAVLLRGINVNGITIRMADLRAALAPLPVVDVSTVLATGNIVCRSSLGAGELKVVVESRLRERFGYDAWVVVLPAERIEALVRACPFPADSATQHAYVTLASDAAALDELVALAAAQNVAGLERLGPEAIAWTAEVGGTLEHPMSRLVAKPRFKSATTTRNLRTLIRIRGALDR